MREIHITLWRHEQEEDWSVKIDGKLHRHVSTTTVDELVEYAVVAAERALLEQEAPGDSNTTFCFGTFGC
jgi:hypothetical protein